MFFIGHRGASAYEPENTLLSMRRAIELGANALECDLRATKDRKIVLFHDPTIDRTTQASGKLKDFTYEEIMHLNAGKGEKIPLLEELLAFCPESIKLFIEVKENGFENELVDLVKNKKNVVLISLKPIVLRKIKKLNPSQETGFIFRTYIHNFPGFIYIHKQLKVEWLFIRNKSVLKSFIKKAKENNFKVIVWTVDSYEDMMKHKKLDLDGIESNHPDLFKYLVD